MDQHNDNRVRPFIRIVAGVRGVGAAVATVLVMVEFIPAILSPTAAIGRRHAMKMVFGALVLMLSVGWLLLKAASTGENPDITDGADDEADSSGSQ